MEVRGLPNTPTSNQRLVFPGFVAEHVMFQSRFPNLAFFSKKLIKKSLSALENIE